MEKWFSYLPLLGKDTIVVLLKKNNSVLTYSGTFLQYSNKCLIIFCSWPSITKGGLQNLQVAI